MQAARTTAAMVVVADMAAGSGGDGCKRQRR
jgi:hypothetical protein